MIRFSCPKCGMQYEIEDELAGVHGVCEGCNAKMVIPSGSSSAPVVAKLVEEPGEPPNAPPASMPEKGGGDLFESVRSSAETVATSSPVASVKPSPRQRRLAADWQNLLKRFANFNHIQVKSCSGNPPERYVIAYNVRGIERLDGERVVYRGYHEVEIKLPGTYPRTPPACRMLTPIFHPNIEPAVICIGDHWTAAERLSDLVIRIGEMIAYQAHNIKSPLDGEAAMWTDLHMDMLPIDSADLTPPDP